MRPNRRETILLAAAAPAAIGMLSVAGTANPTQAQGSNPTGQGGGPQKIETRIGTLEFTHNFAHGYPTDATIDKLYDERDFQRGCQTYLWSLPAGGARHHPASKSSAVRLASSASAGARKPTALLTTTTSTESRRATSSRRCRRGERATTRRRKAKSIRLST
jgi:hypothetical protein